VATQSQSQSQPLSQSSKDGIQANCVPDDTPIRDPILCLANVRDRRNVCPLDTARQTVYAVGRNPSIVDFVLRGQFVSRKHAELRWDAQQARWHLIDLSSAGVWVNDRRIPKSSKSAQHGEVGYPVQLHDTICFGFKDPTVTFTLECWTSPLARLVVVQRDTEALRNLKSSFILDARIRRSFSVGECTVRSANAAPISH